MVTQLLPSTLMTNCFSFQDICPLTSVDTAVNTNKSIVSDIFISCLMEQFHNNSVERSHYNESNSYTELLTNKHLVVAYK